ncbi:hypothetical protein L596_022566 [Steinernema carpocapsae]|uniref:Uncharacterized protein n=1 Tax=Steinernema carpocapsae TaxID=34508 RepID=A0A4V6A090_STECR|nr:hypothetical protein L596_022566 [Steinernema carpocapsae]
MLRARTAARILFGLNCRSTRSFSPEPNFRLVGVNGYLGMERVTVKIRRGLGLICLRFGQMEDRLTVDALEDDESSVEGEWSNEV